MSDSNAQPSRNPKDPAFREHVVQQMIRDGLSPKAAAEEYGLEPRQVIRWKKSYLQQLKTSAKGTTRKAPGRSDPVPVVEDISRKRVRLEDAKRPSSSVPFFSQTENRSIPPADAPQDVAEDASLNKSANSLPPRRAPGTSPRGIDEAPEPIMRAIDQPLPNPGSEISGPAQERFSKNWERMDAGAVPVAAPPQPVRLNSRDRVVTRLQDLPGAGWLLHGGRFDHGPWLIVLFVLIVAAAAFFVVKDAADYTSPEADPVSGETWRYFDPLTSEEILAAEEVITRFFASDSVEALEPLIRAPETVMPLVYRYYDAHPLEQAEVASFTAHRRANLRDLDITLHGVMLEGQLKERNVPTEHTPEGPKVDWEVAVNYQPMAWQDYRLKRPSETTYFRLSLQPSEFYDRPFDPSIFRSFRLDYPGDLRVMYGYALIDTNLELRLREIMPDNESVREVIVGIEFPTGEHFEDKDLVEITELRSESWIVAYEPNERHFDLPPAGLPETSPAEADPVSDDAPLPALDGTSLLEPASEEQTEDTPEPGIVPAVPVEETELPDEVQE